MCNAALLFVSMVGLWAGSVYVPSSRHLPRHPRRLHRAARPRSSPPTPPCCSPPAPFWAACWCPPWPRRIGRRGTLAFYFVLMFVCIAVGFGYVFYLRRDALPWFLTVSLLPRHRRRQFRGLHALAAGAVPHRMPRQRLRLRHLVRPFPRRRHHVPGRRRRRPHAHHRHAGGAHFRRLPGRPRAAALGGGNQR